ncbi:MFS transporter [Paenibacillus pinistramenti]|uniref:MFS transporter n=1 Tax=Paenibacillus pinistramenti TaxID=1768003 RepID=UPI0011081893|nr:MFS transporter [Paenibacillus pinistramenti]
MNARSWLLMISVGFGILLNPLNSSMISVAIPGLQKDFQLDYTSVSWIIFSFYMASVVAQPVMGRASDLFGRRRIFLAGLGVAFTASLLAPLSASFGWLIVFRVLQSIGTSMMSAVGMALVRIHITEKQASALSVLSIFLSGAAAIGPFAGGVLIHWWDWHAIFFVNIPFVAVSFILAWKIIPKDERPASARRGLPPLISLRTFTKYPEMTLVNFEFMLVNLLYYSIFFGFPSYLQLVRHVSDYHTGILMLTLGICSLVSSPLAGRWVDQSGPRPAFMLSAALMTFGSVWLVLLNSHSPLILAGLALAAFGVSNGLNSVAMQAALFNSSPKEIIGAASGLFNTSRYIGTLLSSLLISMIMGGQFSSGGFRILGIFLILTALSLLGLSLQRRGAKQPQ